MVISSESATVLWASVPGQRYQVKYRQGYEGQEWLDVGTGVVTTGTTSQLQDDEPGDEGRRLYRVILVD